MTTLFGRNPLVTAVIGAALLAIGLALQAVLLPWIGGALVVVGVVRLVLHARGRGASRSGTPGDRGRTR